MPTVRLSEFFNGVAEHGAGHFVGMLAEEIAKEVHGNSLTHFS